MAQKDVARVSVVMAVYNSPSQLVLTIDSVLAQTGVDLEIIIVDDGSNQETRKILATYANSAAVTILEQSNAGITAALIKGCEIASHEYIARIDVGDEMLQNRLYAQAQVLQASPQIGLVCSNVVTISPEGEILNSEAATNEQLILGVSSPLSKHAKTPVHSSTMFRKDLFMQVGGYRWQFYFAQDLDLWSRLAEASEIILLPNPLTKITVTADGISSRYTAEQTQLRKLIAAMIRARSEGESELALLDRAAKIRPVCNSEAKQRDFAGNYFLGKWLLDQNSVHGKKYILAALRARPLSLRAWLAWVRSIASSRSNR